MGERSKKRRGFSRDPGRPRGAGVDAQVNNAQIWQLFRPARSARTHLAGAKTR